MAGTPRIFVSHSHSDNAYCRDFVATLRHSLGSAEAVWYDEHNLGWGALRQTIDQELRQRQHFIVILSPTAIASDWVNTEIDAALALLRSGSMRTIQFVTALPYEVPPTLLRYKRIERPGGGAAPPTEAAARALDAISDLPSMQTAPQSASLMSPLPSAARPGVAPPLVAVPSSTTHQQSRRRGWPRPSWQSVLLVCSAIVGFTAYQGGLPWCSVTYTDTLYGATASTTVQVTGTQLGTSGGLGYAATLFQAFLITVLVGGFLYLLGLRFRSPRSQQLVRLVVLLGSLGAGVCLVLSLENATDLIPGVSGLTNVQSAVEYGFFVAASAVVGIAVGSMLPRHTRSLVTRSAKHATAEIGATHL